MKAPLDYQKPEKPSTIIIAFMLIGAAALLINAIIIVAFGARLYRIGLLACGLFCFLVMLNLYLKEKKRTNNSRKTL